MQERAEAVNGNKTEIEGLFDKRSSAEQAFLERYMAAAEASGTVILDTVTASCTRKLSPHQADVSQK